MFPRFEYAFSNTANIFCFLNEVFYYSILTQSNAQVRQQLFLKILKYCLASKISFHRRLSSRNPCKNWRQHLRRLWKLTSKHDVIEFWHFFDTAQTNVRFINCLFQTVGYSRSRQRTSGIIHEWNKKFIAQISSRFGWHVIVA